MLFCKDCGVALGIFGKDERDYCPACVQHHKPPTPTPQPTLLAAQDEFLADAVLSLEEGRLVLRSKEGWELWSGGSIDLKTLFARARRIYAIRLRRQKN